MMCRYANEEYVQMCGYADMQIYGRNGYNCSSAHLHIHASAHQLMDLDRIRFGYGYLGLFFVYFKNSRGAYNFAF